MNTLTLKRITELPTIPLAMNGPMDLDEAEALGHMMGAATIYYWPATRTAFASFEPVKITVPEEVSA